MRLWNLSSFEEIAPSVITHVESTTGEHKTSHKRTQRRIAAPLFTAVGTAVVVAAMNIAPVKMMVMANDVQSSASSCASESNIVRERPPLEVVFSADHSLKWNSATEDTMLEKAATALSGWDRSKNTSNFVQSGLREQIATDENDAIDLDALGIRLG